MRSSTGRIVGELYAGIGYHLDYYYAIDDEYYRMRNRFHPGIDSTPHHYYSDTNNFNHNDYMLSGVSLNVVYDTRDNLINPYKGIYANINYRINPTWLGQRPEFLLVMAGIPHLCGTVKENGTESHGILGFWQFQPGRQTALPDPPCAGG